MFRTEESARESEHLPSPQCNLNDLFNSRRILDKNFLKVVIYFPVGIFLVVIRTVFCIAGLLLLCLVSRQLQLWSYVFKGLCAILGLVVQVDDKGFDPNSKVLIANHVSIFDRYAVNMVQPCFIYTEGSEMKNVDIIAFWRDTDVKHEVSDENDVSTFQSYVQRSNIPVLNFAEGATTNGKIGLLKFRRESVSTSFNIQPVLIKTSTPFITISPSVLGSSMLSDVLWSFYVPYICYDLKVLPCIARVSREELEDFSTRVQRTMAEAMNLIPTVYTSTNKLELITRMRTVGTSVSEKTPAEDFSEILCRSRELAQKGMLSFNTAAKSFGKTPKERMLSYQERKTMLIEAARAKYLEKQKVL